LNIINLEDNIDEKKNIKEFTHKRKYISTKDVINLKSLRKIRLFSTKNSINTEEDLNSSLKSNANKNISLEKKPFKNRKKNENNNDDKILTYKTSSKNNSNKISNYNTFKEIQFKDKYINEENTFKNSPKILRNNYPKFSNLKNGGSSYKNENWINNTLNALGKSKTSKNNNFKIFTNFKINNDINSEMKNFSNALEKDFNKENLISGNNKNLLKQEKKSSLEKNDFLKFNLLEEKIIIKSNVLEKIKNDFYDNIVLNNEFEYYSKLKGNKNSTINDKNLTNPHCDEEKFKTIYDKNNQEFIKTCINIKKNKFIIDYENLLRKNNSMQNNESLTSQIKCNSSNKNQYINTKIEHLSSPKNNFLNNHYKSFSPTSNLKFLNKKIPKNK